jgi:hypothetical protein
LPLGALDNLLSAGRRSRTAKLSRREIVDILLIGVGVLLVIFLGIMLFSLLDMAQETDEAYDLLDRGEEMATPMNPYYVSTSETLLSASLAEERPERDLCGSGAGQ